MQSLSVPKCGASFENALHKIIVWFVRVNGKIIMIARTDPKLYNNLLIAQHAFALCAGNPHP